MTLRTAEITHAPAQLLPLPMDMATDLFSASGRVWSQEPGPINTKSPMAIRSSPLRRMGYIRTVLLPKSAKAPEIRSENILERNRTDRRYSASNRRDTVVRNLDKV